MINKFLDLHEQLITFLCYKTQWAAQFRRKLLTTFEFVDNISEPLNILHGWIWQIYRKSHADMILDIYCDHSDTRLKMRYWRKLNPLWVAQDMYSSSSNPHIQLKMCVLLTYPRKSPCTFADGIWGIRGKWTHCRDLFSWVQIPLSHSTLSVLLEPCQKSHFAHTSDLLQRLVNLILLWSF